MQALRSLPKQRNKIIMFKKIEKYFKPKIPKPGGFVSTMLIKPSTEDFRRFY